MSFGLRLSAFALTALLWGASAGVLAVKEMLPVLKPETPTYYQRLFRVLPPYEDFWYGLYYQDEPIGGMRVFYEVEEDGIRTQALLKPTFWCYPMEISGEIRVDMRYRWEASHWDLRLRRLKGFLEAKPSGDVVEWRGKLGAREVAFRMPLEKNHGEIPMMFPSLEQRMLKDGWRETFSLPGPGAGESLKISLSTHARTREDGQPGFLCEMRADNFTCSLWADARGNVTRVDLPYGLVLRREKADKVVAGLKQSQSRQGDTQIEALVQRMEKTLETMAGVSE